MNLTCSDHFYLLSSTLQFNSTSNFCTLEIICLLFNLFQSTVAFHIENSHLFCFAKQMTGFYIKRNTGLKWVKRTFQRSLPFLIFLLLKWFSSSLFYIFKRISGRILTVATFHKMSCSNQYSSHFLLLPFNVYV